MTEIVDDLSTLARFGRTVERTVDVDVATVARRVWGLLATAERTLTIRTDATVEADPTRLELLLERLFEFSTKNGATEVAIDATDTEIVLTDDGAPIASEQVAGAFAYGEAVPDAGSGMSLPIARTIAEAHGWGISIDTAYTDGVRIRIEP
jgi:signal transduction histidine kinase